MKYTFVKCNIIIIGIHIEIITVILFTKYIICRMNYGFEVQQRKTKYTKDWTYFEASPYYEL